MEHIQALANQLGEALAKQQWVATTAESCTGGGVATAITDIAGSSQWFERAFITYSNEAKMQMLGVQAETLANYGAVSEPVVEQMAEGALTNSLADISVAISGIAGPTGGTEEKPVGTVWFAWADKQGWRKTMVCQFSGNRSQVRYQAITQAILGMLHHLAEL
ncbi:nicotinamide-nucleotide amidase [Photobacterium damselae]|uniref:nicotinamide-nucleotide amidase n=1 Tax=Photobacterium damselae TaxID=38293 RepID=UPI002090CE59|nr:nicotinamide-nucleotide amidase [Photobacterium damselae]USR76851.1 nicotinamide-nucleotide amidase [Photobacterium damselae]